MWRVELGAYSCEQVDLEFFTEVSVCIDSFDKGQVGYAL